MNKLEIIDLHVSVDGQEIIKGITIAFEAGKTYALMGPNGSGKSTLVNAIMGHPRYVITNGKIILNGKDITTEKPHLRAQAGLFLSFQHPAEIPGVNVASFLRTAVNSVTGKNHSVLDFHKLMKEKMNLLRMDSSFSRRSLNENFSGGEKKRMEMLQLLLLRPAFSFLDETDSGLDVDVLSIVAQGIAAVKQETKMAIIVITHNPRFLNYLHPEVVHIIAEGKIKASGGPELIQKIEQEGFSGVLPK